MVFDQEEFLLSLVKLKKNCTLLSQVIALLTLLLFSAYTIFIMSIAEQSLFSFGYQLITSLDTAQIVFDLYILAILAIVWMYQDTKSRGKSIQYWLLFSFITLIFISIVLLLYLVLKPSAIDTGNT